MRTKQLKRSASKSLLDANIRPRNQSNCILTSLAIGLILITINYFFFANTHTTQFYDFDIYQQQTTTNYNINNNISITQNYIIDASQHISTKKPTINNLPNTKLKNIKHIFYGIFCTIKDINNRNLIRTGLNNQLNNIKQSGISYNINFIYKFIICETVNSMESKLEQAKYNDLIILNMTENMNKGKTFKYFQYIKLYSNISANSIVFKADIDAFIWLQSLFISISNINLSKYIFYGRQMDNVMCGGGDRCPPKNCYDFYKPRNNCWVYMSGGIYAMSKSLIDILFTKNMELPMMEEDLTIARLIHAKTEKDMVETYHIKNNGSIYCHRSVYYKSVQDHWIKFQNITVHPTFGGNECFADTCVAVPNRKVTIDCVPFFQKTSNLF